MDIPLDLDGPQDYATLPIRNGYPDPDFTPRFPWLGQVEAGFSVDDFEDALPDTQSTAREELATRGLDWGNDGIHRRRDLRDKIIDADYEYLEDSAISDEFVSEADSDAHILGTSSLSKTDRQQSRDIAGARGAKARRIHKGRGGKGFKKGPRKPLEPSQEFKELHSQATLSFIDHDYDQAEEYIQRAILHNPEMFTAYSLLSEIHLARGDKDRALLALFHGAHTRPRDTDVWSNVAELILERAGDDRSAAIRDAIYCYNRVIGVDPAQTHARYRRASLYFELGYKGKAIWEYERLLKLLPHDTKVLRHIAELYTELGDVERAITHYDNSIAYYKFLEPKLVTTFTWSDVNIYAELFSYSSQPKEGILKVKALSRWLLSRGEDEFWDQYNADDREFDAFDAPRRIEVPEFKRHKHETSAFGEGLPLELRIKLGLLRLKLEDCELEEAMRHFEWLEPEDNRTVGKLFDYFDLFRDVANALRLRNQFSEALRFYEPLQKIDDYTDSSYFGEVALCYEALGLHNEAEGCYRTILRNDEGNVDVRIQLIKMFENANVLHRASPYLAEIVSMSNLGSTKPRNDTLAMSNLPANNSLSRNTDDLEPPISPGIPTMLKPLPPPKPSKKYASKKRTQESEAQENLRMLFLQMQDLKQAVHDGHSLAKLKWMRIARVLIEKFRKRKTFFPLDRCKKFLGYSKEAGTKSARSKATQVLEEVETTVGPAHVFLDGKEDVNHYIPNEYCDITFDDWLDIFLEYAILVALDGDSSLAYETITVTTDANVFYHSSSSVCRIHICWFTCALVLNDSETLCNVARYFMKELQFVTDSYRLFAVLNRLCDEPNSFYNSGPSQKYILRQIKAMDFCLVGDQQRRVSFQEKATCTSRDENGNPIKAEELDIGLLMLYGHVLYAGRSYSFALNYFFRAYALDPTNAMINLSLGLGYLHYALKRQSENRHYLIMQGLSFLLVYYDHRSNSEFAIDRQEAECNVGRAYHMIGLTHLAIPYYERCLEFNGQVRGEVANGVLEMFTREAAFALQGLWATSGKPELAGEVTKRWLLL